MLNQLQLNFIKKLSFATLMILFSSSISFAQVYNMDGTPITDCSGFFYDSGGSNGNYGSSESLTTTICSDATSGTHVQLIFSAVDLAAGDLICFFDGMDATAPALSCNTDFLVGSPFIIQATAANTSGCLTITFNSDGSGEAAGWQADMNCIPSCQTILANLVSSDPVASPPDTGYIDICQGERVFFFGEGSYPQDGVVYDHSDFTSAFEWNFGDGTTGLGPNVSHIYNESGGYIVQLTITDQFGCTNTNFINQRVRVSTTPSFDLLGNIPDQLCAGDTLELSAGVNQSDSSSIIGVNTVQGSFPTAGVVSDTTSLPDGTGSSFNSPISFSNFSPGQVLNNVNDIVSICIIMEHSWMRDLEMALECPDGTSIILHNHPGPIGGEVFLGEPFELDEGFLNPIPGVGYEYCWTPDATNGTWIEFANNTNVGTLPAGNYNSFDPLSNLLGCPLNGQWTINVQDLWGVDNGFIFEWSIEFQSNLYPAIETFTSEIIDFNWTDNPSIFFQTNDSIAASPQNAGTASYIFTVEDDFGCAYDTSILVAILPPTHPDCFSCPNPDQLLTDTTICDGELVQINAETTISLADQAITFEAFPTYLIGNANHPPTDPYAALIDVTTINPGVITNAEAQICGVCLDLETDFTADIRIHLRSPSGEVIELSTTNGGAGDNYTNTCFTPSASVSIIGSSAPFTGNFVPEGDWSDLNGSTINGTWELLISDGFGINDFGLLKSWSICFNTENDVVYDWAPVAGLSCYNCPDPLATPFTTSTYSLQISDDYGCEILDTMTVNVLSVISAPLNLSCDTIFNGNLSFIWDQVPGISDYIVNINGTGWIPASSVDGHIVSGLVNGDPVSIEVQANISNASCSVGVASAMCTYFNCDIELELPPNGITSPSCFNTNDGSVFVNAIGVGTGPFTYQINSDPPQGNGIFSGVPAGDHVIILMDVDGCSDTLDVNVPALDPITIDIVADSVDCNGTATGGAAATGMGGAGNFNYAWNTTPLQTFTQSISGVAAGDYIVTATDGNGCQLEQMVTIGEPTAITAMVTTTNVACNSGDDGSAMATPSGGTGTYTYSWSNGQTTATANTLTAGTYTVTIMDANQCQIEVTEVISEPTGMTLNANIDNVNCFGDSSGNIDLEVIGGAVGYTYLWSDNATTQDQLNIAADTYCVTVTDGNLCSIDTCFTITESPVLTLTLAATSTTCIGNNMDGTATAFAQGGSGSNYSYVWNNTQTTSTAIDLIPDNYCVTVTDGLGCTAVDCIDVSNPDAIVIDSIVAIDVLCNGENSGFAEVFVSGGDGNFTYLWSDQLAQFSNPANSLAQGTYTVTITDGAACTATASIVVNEPAILTAVISPTDVNCFNGNDGEALANPSGGVEPYNYAWNSLPGQFEQTATNLPTGGYIVTVTDNNGCTAIASTQIDEPATAVSTIVTQDFQGCADQNNSILLAIPSGGTGTNYTYVWDNAPVSNANTATNLDDNTTYTVTVTDVNGCEITASLENNDLDPIDVNIIQIPPTCNGNSDGQIGVNFVSGGLPGMNGTLTDYNYSWSNNISNVLNPNLTAGTYTVLVTDIQGCTSQNEVNLTEPVAIEATANIIDASCFGLGNGEVEVNSNTNITGYQWDTNTNNQLTQTATNLAAGTYFVTLTDDNDCTASTSFEVGEPTPLDVDFVTEDNPCAGDNIGTIMTTVTGGTAGYTYSWSNTDTTNIFSSIDQNPIDLFANLYTVTITDSNGCEQIDSVIVDSPEPLWAQVDADSVTCFGDSDGSIFINAQGGEAPFTYSLDGDNFSATSTFLGLESGGYTAYIEDRNGCQTTFTTAVGGPEPIVVDLGDNFTINLGETANLNSTVTPAGNYFYNWSPSDSLTCADCPNPDAIKLNFQTSFQLTVEDEFGCSARDVVTVFVNKFRRVLVPTGFSPNGDGNNDVLRPHGDEGTTVNVFRVYDRWGELVYQNELPFGINDLDVGWDGLFRSKELNPAVFVWYMEVEYIDGAKGNHKGQTTLIK